MKKLYLITGFLGSGKTTFLNNLLTDFKSSKIGVIVNEFGKIGIDGKLISKSGCRITEICNGSIFCSCRTDMFLDALKNAADSDIDVLFVEASGLCDPLSIDSILENLYLISNVKYDYCGSVCLVDAKNFVKVYSTAVVIKSQLMGASLVIINKTDISSEENLQIIKEKVRQLNTECSVLCTSYGKINTEKILNLKPIKVFAQNNKVDVLSSSLTVNFLSPVETDTLKEFLNEIKDITYRCKGYVNTTEGVYFVDGVMNMIKLDRADAEQDINSLTVLYNSKYPVLSKVKELQNKYNYVIF